jgi:hypothetical protein
MLRKPGPVLTHDDTSVNDEGVDIISATASGITFTGAVTTVAASGGLALPTVADPDGKAAGLPGKFSFVATGAIDDGSFLNGTTVLDLTTPLSAGPGGSTFVAGVVPRSTFIAYSVPRELRNVRQDVIVSTALKELLQQFGVEARSLDDPAEYRVILAGRGFFDDLPRPAKYSVSSKDNTVVVNRLGYEPVLPVAETYRSLFYPEATEPIGPGQHYDLKRSHRDQIVKDFEAAWAAYRHAQKDSDVGGGVGLYNYAASHDEHAAAAGRLRALHLLLNQIEHLGLTELEVRQSENEVLRLTTPSNMTAAQLKSAILAAPPAAARQPQRPNSAPPPPPPTTTTTGVKAAAKEPAGADAGNGAGQ